MLFLFNGTAELNERPTVQVKTIMEEGKANVVLDVTSVEGVSTQINLFSTTDPQLLDVVKSKCNPCTKDGTKLSRRFLNIVGRKVLFDYKNKEAKSYLSEDKIKGQDKYYGRSIIVLVNPGRVRVCVDKRNFGPIAHTFIKDANVTVSILMPRWSRWWKLKHPVYIETCKFDTRINLLSLSFIENEGTQSNILKYEDKAMEIPPMEGVTKDKVNKDTERKPFKKEFKKEGYKPNGGKKPFNKDGQRKPYNKDFKKGGFNNRKPR